LYGLWLLRMMLSIMQL